MKTKNQTKPILFKKSENEYHMQFSTEDIKKLIEKNVIDENLGKNYLNHIENNNRASQEWKEFLKSNPTEQEINNFLAKQEKPNLEEIKKNFNSWKQLEKLFVENWDFFFSEIKTEQTTIHGLFNASSIIQKK